jgi:hypothetical protein
VMLTSCSKSTVILLLWCFATSSVHSQTDGAVSSSEPVAVTPPASSNSKELPWKFLASPIGVLSRDWTVQMIRDLGQSEHWDCKKPQDCVPTPQRVETLVHDTVGDGPTKAKPAYVAIHVVDYAPNPANKTPDAWYVYRSKESHWGDPKWDYQKFTGKRIYGSPSVLFLFLHLHTRAISIAEAEEKLSAKLEKARTDDEAIRQDAKKKDLKGDDVEKYVKQGLLDRGWADPALAEILVRLPKETSSSELDRALRKNALSIPNAGDPQHSTPIAICETNSGDRFQWLGNVGLPTTYANVHYESAVVKRTPANIANLKLIAGLLFGAQGRELCVDIDAEDAIVWGAGRIESIGLPSDVTIAGYKISANIPVTDQQRTTELIGATGAFNDEQLYWWDASIGIPVHKIKDLQYSSSDNTVVASQVDRQSVYAMFNLMLHPVDLSDTKSNVWPRFLVGFPLSSNPWDKLFAGGGIGIPLKPLQNFQFFAGATFNRTQQPATLTAGSTANNAQLQNDLKITTTPKFTFGINVPVKSVFDKLRK